jgi:hypothetical protein
MLIWTHPWLTVALSAEGVGVPPERPPGEVRWSADLATGLTDTELEEWGGFVRTGWGVAALRTRLGDGAVIVRVWSTERECLRGTCVVRPRSAELWLLETLVARPQRAGWGSATMHAAIRTVWDRGGCRVGFVWELGAGGLLRAWWRGWLGAAVSVERGWMWSVPRPLGEGACGFCPNTAAWLPPPHGSPVMPVVVSGRGWTVVVSDSGLLDGWGYVLAVSGESKEMVNWTRVAAVGGWRHLWFAGSSAPEGWRWSGEVVVRGIINKGWKRTGGGESSPTAWITAEVSSGSF